jgi:heme exporter protein A
MKQRLKYCFALLHRPPILVLDEPMANLDVDGVATVRQVMDEQRQEGILVVATNDLSDCAQADAEVNLDGRP